MTIAENKPLPVRPRPIPPSPSERVSRYLLGEAASRGVVVTLSLRGGKSVQGTIQRFDSFTVALRRVEDKRLRLYFKHAIDCIEFPDEVSLEESPRKAGESRGPTIET